MKKEKPSRPLRIYLDKKKKLYYILNGKDRHYIGESNKPSPTIVNKVFNIIAQQSAEKKKRKRKKKKKAETGEAASDTVDGTVGDLPTQGTVEDPSGAELTPFDKNRQRQLYLTDALAQKFIARDNLLEAAPMNQPQQENAAAPPALTGPERNLLTIQDQIFLALMTQGRDRAVDALYNVRPQAQSAYISEIDDDSEPDHSRMYHNIMRETNELLGPSESDQSEPNNPLGNMLDVMTPGVPRRPFPRRTPPSSASEAEASSASSAAEASAAEASAAEEESNSDLLPISEAEPQTEEEPDTPPRERNRRSQRIRERNQEVDEFAEEVKLAILQEYPKNKSGRRYIPKAMRSDVETMVARLQILGPNLYFGARAQTEYAIDGVDRIVEHFKANRKPPKYIKAVLKVWANGLVIAFGKDPIYPEVGEDFAEIQRSQGSGDSLMSNGKALWNTEIMELLGDNPSFAGICMRDEITDLMTKELEKGKKKFGFIYNTDVKGLPGTHWRAIWCDLSDGKQVCHYDSFGKPMEADIKKTLKRVMNKAGLPEFMKLKENRVPHQRKESQRCGYHSVLFLDRMSHGSSFVNATDINELIASNLEKEFKKFSHV